MQTKLDNRPAEVVRAVIDTEGVVGLWTPRQRRLLEIQEQRAPRIVAKAESLGVEVEYLGAFPIFEKPRAFQGPKSGWLLGPADPRTAMEVVPRKQLADLEKLRSEGIHFPCMYVAHEVDADRFRSIVPVDRSPYPVPLDAKEAASLVDAPPPPRSTVELSGRLARRSQQIVHALAGAVPVLGAIAISPFVLAGTALASVVDPVVLGVTPVERPVEGVLACWFILARWDW